MSYCLTPGCFQPQNPDSARFCLTCGSKLWLRERYRPFKPIGQGGFGRTFLAIDEDMPAKPPCVIKQLCLQSQGSLLLNKAMQLFHQEAENLEKLGEHPQIPTLFAHFEQNKQLYLVQEWIEGETLKQELQQTGPFKENQIWQLLRNLLSVLKFVHENKVIHRDIKPHNIMRRRQNQQAVLIDFGVAKFLTGTALLQTGTVVGTAEYLAPEQTKGKAFPASDLYSLGVTCIHLLTDIPPFDLFDIVDSRWVWRDYLPKNTVVSDRLSYILDRLLESTLRKRYQSATEVLQELDRQIPSPTADVDYQPLENFLAAGKWQKADQETWQVMSQVAGKFPGNYLQVSDIEKFPCQDLLKIDQLWLKYSRGRFGFSVQKQIFEQVAGGEYSIFCQEVGWPVHRVQVLDSVLQFNRKAPLGHLPSRRWMGGYSWWKHARFMAEKLEQCSIF